MTGVLLQGGAMGLFLVLGALFPRVRGVPLLNRDLWLNLVNGALLFALVRLTLVSFVAARSQIGLLDLGWLQAGWAQLLFSVVLLDFARYWLHYAHHRVPFFWKFHRVHHCAEFIDSSTGLRMHVVDFTMLAALPILLFGVLLDVGSFEPWVIPVTMGVGVVFDAFEHSNLRMDSRHPLYRAWNLLFNSPHFHSWHHTREGKVYDGNYSNTFVIWDRLFGTEVTRPDPPDQYGIVDWDTLENSVAGFWLLRLRHPDRAAAHARAPDAPAPADAAAP
jgi:sterol desaturase/sphingolipid hydroxylase (fatty acid hydroxylase superfamily)